MKRPLMLRAVRMAIAVFEHAEEVGAEMPAYGSAEFDLFASKIDDLAGYLRSYLAHYGISARYLCTCGCDNPPPPAPTTTDRPTLTALDGGRDENE
jgi:hypothetical protein